MLAEEILGELDAGLPPAVLLLGAPGDDLEALARTIFTRRHLKLHDLRWCRRLTAEAAREIAAETFTHQPIGDFLGFVIPLDEASEQAQHVLLKVLEEPPPTARYLLTAFAGSALPAIVSRCRVYHVYDAMTVTRPAREDNAKAAAAAAVRAALTRDPAVLAEALRAWGEGCPCKSGEPHDKGEHYRQALAEWAVRHVTTVMFSDGNPPDPIVSQRKARAVLQVLGDYPRARPQNAAAAALSLAFLEDS